MNTAPAAMALTDAECDVADAIIDTLEADRTRDYSPSQLARKVHTDTATSRRVLEALHADVYIAASGNGCWTRYSARP